MSKPINKENPGRNFEVLVPQLGIWRKGQVFSEFQFRQLHPSPKATMQQDPSEVEPAEDFYKRILDRHLNDDAGDGVNVSARKATIRVVADREPDPIDSADIAAHNPKTKVNPMILEALKYQRERDNVGELVGAGGRK